MIGLRRVLVVAAHPDDEILGCGGTMAAHIAAGDDVTVMIVAEGITSRGPVRETAVASADLKALQDAARLANEIIGVRKVMFFGFPDNRLDSIDLLDLVKPIEQNLRELQPHVVYTHFRSDLNVDHQRVGDAVVTACRPLPGSVVCELLHFEVPSSTEWQTGSSHSGFHPNWYVDISETLSAKCDALRVYQTEMRDWPHPRSIQGVEHLARWRGSSAGFEAAEAYSVGRVRRRIKSRGGAA